MTFDLVYLVYSIVSKVGTKLTKAINYSSLYLGSDAPELDLAASLCTVTVAKLRSCSYSQQLSALTGDQPD
jgi:hypothetical protein